MIDLPCTLRKRIRTPSIYPLCRFTPNVYECLGVIVTSKTKRIFLQDSKWSITPAQNPSTLMILKPYYYINKI